MLLTHFINNLMLFQQPPDYVAKVGAITRNKSFSSFSELGALVLRTAPPKDLCIKPGLAMSLCHSESYPARPKLSGVLKSDPFVKVFYEPGIVLYTDT